MNGPVIELDSVFDRLSSRDVNKTVELLDHGIYFFSDISDKSERAKKALDRCNVPYYLVETVYGEIGIEPPELAYPFIRGNVIDIGIINGVERIEEFAERSRFLDTLDAMKY